MIDSKKYVPEHYSKSRDFQVFLKLLDLIINASKSDIDYMITCLSPEACKARILPLLSNYVGYNYDYEERVNLNRIITKNWANLKRDRGSLPGLKQAVSLAFQGIDEIEDLDVFQLFNIDFITEVDQWGREYDKFRIYLYYPAFLSKLHDLVEAVRPAGTAVEIVNAQFINAVETVSLTDSFKIMGYNYTTGKLVRIGDIPIYIENSWEIMDDTMSAHKYLVDNKFYDDNHIELGAYVDENQRILTNAGTPTGYVIKPPNIYIENLGITASSGRWSIILPIDTKIKKNSTLRIIATDLSTLSASNTAEFQQHTSYLPYLILPTKQSKLIKGYGIPDASITCVINNNSVTTKVNSIGTWSVELPEGLTEETVIEYYQTELKKSESLHLQWKFGDTITSPSIDSITSGDSLVISGHAQPNSRITLSIDGKTVDLPSTLQPTNYRFNLEHSARVLNSCYQIRTGGKPTDYFITADSWRIVSADRNRYKFYLQLESSNNTLIRRVYTADTHDKCCWYVDNNSGFFVKDDNGLDPTTIQNPLPWDEYCYISKKRYVMNTVGDIMYATEYFINAYEDIEDQAGNIILSRKDRYHVSDSAGVGFSEVHGVKDDSVTDKSWLTARSYAYQTDRDYWQSKAITDYNDYAVSDSVTDTRIKLTAQLFEIDPVIREYDTTNNIGEITTDSSNFQNNSAEVVIDKLSKDIYTNADEVSKPRLYITTQLHGSDQIDDVFSKIMLTFDNSEVGNSHTILMSWKLKQGAEQHYNVAELPTTIAFSNKGTILPKRLRFKMDSPIRATAKVYDGTTTANKPYQVK